MCKYNEKTDLPIFQHLASRPDADLVVPQESVAVFLLAILGCARFDETPPLYAGGDSPEHVAWKTIGEILFWTWRGTTAGCDDSRAQALWTRLQGQAALATADVVYQLAHSCYGAPHKEMPDLIAAFPEEIGWILEQCISNKESLPSVFGFGGSRKRNAIRFVIATLGRIGRSQSIPVLQVIVDDREFGKDAIRAIELIRRNVMSRRGNSLLVRAAR